MCDGVGKCTVVAAYLHIVDFCFVLQALNLPLSIEDRLPSIPGGKFRRLASRVDFDLNQQKSVVSDHRCSRLLKTIPHRLIHTGRAQLPPAVGESAAYCRPNGFNRPGDD